MWSLCDISIYLYVPLSQATEPIPLAARELCCVDHRLVPAVQLRQAAVGGANRYSASGPQGHTPGQKHSKWPYIYPILPNLTQFLALFTLFSPYFHGFWPPAWPKSGEASLAVPV